MAKIKTYYGLAPYSWKTHARVNVERLTAAQKKKVVAHEVCDGGDGRCKCPARCTWAIIPKEPVGSTEDESTAMDQTFTDFGERECTNAVERRAIFAEANRRAGRELESLYRVLNAQLEKRLGEISVSSNND